ncbi:MAG: tRNA 2-thiouridine(34) synthase MnmA [Actinobacteria bacterium]|nr:tRNA 2-thiouridine(34) synthase MnmA [Actinomycetota bacterium]
MKVLAAVSGGVDSAVALARAVAAGHDVTAVHFALQPNPELVRNGARGCCTISDAHDARRAADRVGVPFYVWDVAGDFQKDVMADFVSEYEQGRTPNPCIRCNQHIKFAAVLDRAVALGFDLVVTGHYARISQDPDGPLLSRAIDPRKDQSYVLAVLGRENLSRCWFPVGDTTKPEIRAEAAGLGLNVAGKPDSHDICFIPDGDTAGFLERRLGARPGDIVDVDSGEVLGHHSGSYGFTIGQRKGLALSRPSADGSPRYVVGIDPQTRTITVGGREHLAVATITAQQPTWCRPVPAPGASLHVQVRAHGTPVPGRLAEVGEESFRVELAEPLFGLAPGQSCVLYDSDVVLGQGTVTHTG